MVCPDISREEIVNACGVDDVHDGVNYTRTACVIAVTKAREYFEPFLHQLGYRLAHVLRRMLPIAMHLLQRDNASLTGHDLFLKRLGAAYHAYIDEIEQHVREKCLEDLQSVTKYVSWSLHTKSRAGLKAMLSRVPTSGSGDSKSQDSSTSSGMGGMTMMDVLENTLWSRKLGVLSEEIVAALVCQIFEGIRDHIVMTTELKFNCFFLMPVVDEFPTRLREELEMAYEEDLDSVFDVASVRAALETRRKGTEAELAQVERLQRKFAAIHSTLAHAHGPSKVAVVDSVNGPSEGLRASMQAEKDKDKKALGESNVNVPKVNGGMGVKHAHSTQSLRESREVGRPPLSMR